MWNKGQSYSQYSTSVCLDMVKPTLISEALKLKKRLIDNKAFLVRLEKSKTNKGREKLLHLASPQELHILKDIISNISSKEIEISKSVLKTKRQLQAVIDLIKRFQKTTSVHKLDSALRKFLIKFASSLPLVAGSVLV